MRMHGEQAVRWLPPLRAIVHRVAIQPLSSHWLPLKRIAMGNVLASCRTLWSCLGDTKMRLHAMPPVSSSSNPPTVADMAAAMISMHAKAFLRTDIDPNFSQDS